MGFSCILINKSDTHCPRVEATADFSLPNILYYTAQLQWKLAFSTGSQGKHSKDPRTGYRGVVKLEKQKKTIGFPKSHLC